VPGEYVREHLARQSMSARIVAAISLVFAVATGCSEAPWIHAASRDVIVLRWYPDTHPEAAARAKAAAHCTATGRNAALATTEISGSVQIATFYCY
jgi:hypothetical protein